MRKIKEFFQWLLFMLYLPDRNDESSEEWALLNRRNDWLDKKAEPFQYTGSAGVRLAFRELATPNQANLLMLHAVRQILKRDPSTGTLVATQISEWFQARATAEVPQNYDEELVRALVEMFCELKMQIDPGPRVDTWFAIINLYPEIAGESYIPQEIGRITRADSLWLFKIYATIRRPEASPQPSADRAEAEAEAAPATTPTTTENVHRDKVETLGSEILCSVALQDLSVPDLTFFAFRHPNPGVRINAVTVLSGLASPLDLEAVDGAMTGDMELSVRLHCAQLREKRGLPFSNCVLPLLDLFLLDRPEQIGLAQRFIVKHDIEAVPALVAALDPKSPFISIQVVSLLYAIFKGSPTRHKGAHELIAAFKPHAAALAAILPCPWIESWTAGRLAYMLAVVEKQLLLPTPTEVVVE